MELPAIWRGFRPRLSMAMQSMTKKWLFQMLNREDCRSSYDKYTNSMNHM